MSFWSSTYGPQLEDLVKGCRFETLRPLSGAAPRTLPAGTKISQSSTLPDEKAAAVVGQITIQFSALEMRLLNVTAAALRAHARPFVAAFEGAKNAGLRLQMMRDAIAVAELSPFARQAFEFIHAEVAELNKHRNRYVHWLWARTNDRDFDDYALIEYQEAIVPESEIAEMWHRTAPVVLAQAEQRGLEPYSMEWSEFVSNEAYNAQKAFKPTPIDPDRVAVYTMEVMEGHLAALKVLWESLEHLYVVVGPTLHDEVGLGDTIPMRHLYLWSDLSKLQKILPKYRPAPPG